MEGERGRRWGQGSDGGQVTQGLWVEVRTLVSSLSEMGVPGVSECISAITVLLSHPALHPVVYETD